MPGFAGHIPFRQSRGVATMAIEQPPLPYEKNALEPHISAETLDYHYDKHHAGYVSKLNAAIEGTELADASLEDIVKKSSGGMFNNAAQAWNHTFYWNSMSPNGGGEPTGKLLEAINKAFGSVDKFKEEFAKSAAGNFGSGWTWLVQRNDGSLAIVNTSNAATPITGSDKPLLTVDVWERSEERRVGKGGGSRWAEQQSTSTRSNAR